MKIWRYVFCVLCTTFFYVLSVYSVEYGYDADETADPYDMIMTKKTLAEGIVTVPKLLYKDLTNSIEVADVYKNYYCKPQSLTSLAGIGMDKLRLKDGTYLICGHYERNGCNNRVIVYADVSKIFYKCDSSKALNKWVKVDKRDVPILTNDKYVEATLTEENFREFNPQIVDCYNGSKCLIVSEFSGTRVLALGHSGILTDELYNKISKNNSGKGANVNNPETKTQSSSTKSSDKKTTESTQSGCVNTVGQRECKDGEHKGYFVCEHDYECTKSTLPAHAIDGHCVSAGRNGYKICTATDCNDGWIAKGGWCQKDTISAQEEGKEPAAENEEAPGTEKVEKEPEIAPETPMDAEKDVETENDCPEGKWNETENTCDCGENATWNTEHKKCERIKTETIQILDAKQTTELNKTEEFPQLQKPAENSVLPQVPNLDDESAELEEKLKTAQDALKKAQDKENSWANRAVSATSTAASGVGGMMTASALAERAADKDAEAEMQDYISTMKCEYGKEQQFNFGADEITLPGGNELLEYYTEYKTLADNLKTTKAALGLSAGIESEVLYDRAQSGLYQYSGATRQTGGETSLFRALTDTGGADAAAWADQKDKTKTKLTAGGVTAGVGVVGGATGNYFINRDKKEADSKK